MWSIDSSLWAICLFLESAIASPKYNLSRRKRSRFFCLKGGRDRSLNDPDEKVREFAIEKLKELDK
ncbi:hypothetical protein H6F74_06090 [Trichocoleus sp. FACHB-90]|uniref:hypothetical protein n=1 Tax=Cyanophyceae TaxID=3028117 RepID=UPI001681ED6E|nr:hypothetical protein [Trichocoleus sp. FACHB-90]MBD1925855.1 hypothetical protein [Trichocoleus sp. FACHB-90]